MNTPARRKTDSQAPSPATELERPSPVEALQTRTGHALAREDARAVVASHSITNVGTLVAIAKQQMQTNPEGATYYAQIIDAYARTSAHQIKEF